MKLIRKIRLRRIHAFLLGAMAAYCSMQITSYVTTPAALRFSFESYSTGDEAKDKLLHLFPIGSNADVFFDFMKKTGALQDAEEEIEKEYRDADLLSLSARSLNTNLLSVRSLSYVEPRSLSLFAGMRWDVTVYIDQKNREITQIIVSRFPTGA
jgi:hypothetical protein